jgi:hypothetical protein
MKVTANVDVGRTSRPPEDKSGVPRAEFDGFEREPCIVPSSELDTIHHNASVSVSSPALSMDGCLDYLPICPAIHVKGPNELTELNSLIGKELNSHFTDAAAIGDRPDRDNVVSLELQLVLT